MPKVLDRKADNKNVRTEACIRKTQGKETHVEK